MAIDARLMKVLGISRASTGHSVGKYAAFVSTEQYAGNPTLVPQWPRPAAHADTGQCVGQA
eukprot:2897962-Rhodomonas_salina.2